MNILSQKEDDCQILCIEGDLDASSCLQLDQAISSAVENGEKKILVNCENLNYISSAGLGVFMSYIEHFETNNVIMVIYGLSEKVKNVFTILGLDTLLPITDTKSEALNYNHSK